MDKIKSYEGWLASCLFSSENNFYIYWDIDESFSEKIIIPFIQEMKIQKNKRFWEMNIYINSPWWYLNLANELISLMEQCKNNLIIVKTFVPSFAASAASAIAITWQVRFVWLNARHLVHNPRGIDYTASKQQLKNNIENRESMFEQIVNHYKKYTKIKDIETKLDHDNYRIIWWKNLIKQGLADYIIEDSLI